MTQQTFVFQTLDFPLLWEFPSSASKSHTHPPASSLSSAEDGIRGGGLCSLWQLPQFSWVSPLHAWYSSFVWFASVALSHINEFLGSQKNQESKKNFCWGGYSETFCPLFWPQTPPTRPVFTRRIAEIRKKWKLQTLPMRSLFQVPASDSCLGELRIWWGLRHPRRTGISLLFLFFFLRWNSPLSFRLRLVPTWQWKTAFLSFVLFSYQSLSSL